MADISNSTLGVLVGIALVVSLIGLFSLPQGGLSSITGLGTTGVARINITEAARVNVTTTLIDFGNGTLKQGETSCTLSSDRDGDINDCFQEEFGNDGPKSGGFQLVNSGSVNINVTVRGTKNGSLTSGSTSFWGQANGAYLYRCNGHGNGTDAQNNFTVVQNFTEANTLLCMGDLPSADGTDGFHVDINITIPEGATGLFNDTLTFGASAS